MFGKKQKTDDQNTNLQLNTIVEGTEIIGNIKSLDNIRLDGTIKGNIQSAGKVVLGKNAKLYGNLEADNAEIYGFHQGDSNINRLLILRKNCNVKGAIHTFEVNIEDKANFIGNCVVSGGKLEDNSDDSLIQDPASDDLIY